jgi:hypothetical protein
VRAWGRARFDDPHYSILDGANASRWLAVSKRAAVKYGSLAHRRHFELALAKRAR